MGLGRCNYNQPLVINVYPHNSIAFHIKRKSNKPEIMVRFYGQIEEWILFDGFL